MNVQLRCSYRLNTLTLDRLYIVYELYENGNWRGLYNKDYNWFSNISDKSKFQIKIITDNGDSSSLYNLMYFEVPTEYLRNEKLDQLLNE